MTPEIYFLIGAILAFIYSFRIWQFIGGRAKAYLFDEEMPEIKEEDLPFFPHPFQSIPARSLDASEVYLSNSIPTVLTFFLWPLALVIILPLIILRVLRFFVRATKGINKLRKLAHSHESDDGVVKEEVNKVEF